MGWLGLGKGKVNLGTGITIRSMWLRDGVMNWQAGAGLVYDSDPEKEWQECNNKARIIKEILSSMFVIFTFLAESNPVTCSISARSKSSR